MGKNGGLACISTEIGSEDGVGIQSRVSACLVSGCDFSVIDSSSRNNSLSPDLMSRFEKALVLSSIMCTSMLPHKLCMSFLFDSVSLAKHSGEVRDDLSHFFQDIMSSIVERRDLICMAKCLSCIYQSNPPFITCSNSSLDISFTSRLSDWIGSWKSLLFNDHDTNSQIAPYVDYSQ